MAEIVGLQGREVLDSRGRPTVLAHCRLASGAEGSASVPSGASTGGAEAVELRDRDMTRYRGMGCRRAAGHVSQEIATAVSGVTLDGQRDLDTRLVALDGSADKRRLGSNAILATSIAFARAHAAERGVPLYAHLADMAGLVPSALPMPTVNLFSGGLHAGGQVALQDVLVVPISARTLDEALAMTAEVYACAAELGAKRYGARALVGDEGGLAPPFTDAISMIEDACDAIGRAGLAPGRDVALAIDVAASHFGTSEGYVLDGKRMSSAAMIDTIVGWRDRYPIISIEDGLAEDDWSHWTVLRDRLAGRSSIMGDDLLCTNSARVERAVHDRAADALLLKVNQIGTLSEALDAATVARRALWSVTVSARSGETEDDWLADLAVAWEGDFIKIGSIVRSERLAKYNRLLEISAVTTWQLRRPSWTQ
jgi:enolase